jgi:hypothetical protein
MHKYFMQYNPVTLCRDLRIGTRIKGHMQLALRTDLLVNVVESFHKCNDKTPKPLKSSTSWSVRGASKAGQQLAMSAVKLNSSTPFSVIRGPWIGSSRLVELSHSTKGIGTFFVN